MNILFTYVTPFHPARGGIGRVTDSLTREFLRRGHKVFYLIYPSLMHPFGMNDTEKFEFPAPIAYIPASDLETGVNLDFYKNFINQNKIDIIINQSGCSSDSMLWTKATEWNVPVISCIHSCPARYMKYMWETEIWPLRKDGIIEQLKRIARILLFYRTKNRYLSSERAAYGQVLTSSTKLCLLSENFLHNLEYFDLSLEHKKKLCSCPNPNSFSNEEISDIDLSKKNKTLLYVGLFNDAKGTERLIKIWKRLYKSHPDWEMVIVGGGKQDLEKRLKRLGATLPRLKFEGVKDNPLPYYKKASIF